MNLIDQSVEQLDFALRRRFFWLLAGFREDLVVPVVEQRWRALDLSRFPWLSRHGWEHVQDDVERLAGRAAGLNRAISESSLLGPQYSIGHTYFFDVVGFVARWPQLQAKWSWRGYYLWSKSGKPQPPLHDLWRHSLEPLIEEYLAGIAQTAREQQLRQLREAFLAPIER